MAENYYKTIEELYDFLASTEYENSICKDIKVLTACVEISSLLANIEASLHDSTSFDSDNIMPNFRVSEYSIVGMYYQRVNEMSLRCLEFAVFVAGYSELSEQVISFIKQEFGEDLYKWIDLDGLRIAETCKAQIRLLVSLVVSDGGAMDLVVETQPYSDVIRNVIQGREMTLQNLILSFISYAARVCRFYSFEIVRDEDLVAQRIQPVLSKIRVTGNSINGTSLNMHPGFKKYIKKLNKNVRCFAIAIIDRVREHYYTSSGHNNYFEEDLKKNFPILLVRGQIYHFAYRCDEMISYEYENPKIHTIPITYAEAKGYDDIAKYYSCCERKILGYCDNRKTKNNLKIFVSKYPCSDCRMAMEKYCAKIICYCPKGKK